MGREQPSTVGRGERPLFGVQTGTADVGSGSVAACRMSTSELPAADVKDDLGSFSVGQSPCANEPFMSVSARRPANTSIEEGWAGARIGGERAASEGDLGGWRRCRVRPADGARPEVERNALEIRPSRPDLDGR